MAFATHPYATQRSKVWPAISLVGATVVLLFVLGVLSPSTIRDAFAGLVNAGAALSHTLETGGVTNTEYNHPLLNAASEAELRAAGVDIRDIPTIITSSQEQCAIDALGQGRISAILDGDTVTLRDYETARHCISP